MCDREYIKERVEESTKHIESRLTPIEQGIARIENKVNDINGSVADTVERVRDLEEKTRTKKLDCPYSEDIKELTDSLLTASVLKEFIKEENQKTIDEANMKANNIKWIVAIIAVVFTVISIGVNITIYYLSNIANTP